LPRPEVKAGHAATIGRILAAALAAMTLPAPLAAGFTVARIGEPPIPPALAHLAFALSLVGPVAAAMVAAGRGVDAAARDVTDPHLPEAPQAVARIVIAGSLPGYVAYLARAEDAAAALLPMLAVSLTAIAAAWLLFLHILLRPPQRRAARIVAGILDVGFLSTLLHAGGAWAAPWAALYPAIVFDTGLRFGRWPLIGATLLALGGFAAVWTTTPSWTAPLLPPALVVSAIAVAALSAVPALRRLERSATRRQHAAAEAERLRAVLGHELRMPLHSIVGLGAMLDATPLEPRQRDLLATLRLAAQTMLDVAEGLVDLGRWRAAGTPPEPQPFILHEVLCEAVAVLRPQAHAKGIALGLAIDPRLPPACRGLPRALRQLLLCLAETAVAFGAQGRIDVAARLLRGSGQPPRLMLEVKDPGAGLSPAARTRIAAAFAGAAGEGLGLAVAQELAALLGGTLAFAGEAEQTSIFTAILPLVPDLAAARPPDLARRAIRIVSADPEFVARLQPQLAQWGAAVSWDPAAAVTESILIVDCRAESPRAMPPETVAIAIGDGDALAETAQLVIAPPVTQATLAAAISAAAALERLARTAPRAEPPLLPVEPFLLRRPLTLLVAEDNPASAKLLRHLLSAAGHSVEVASDSGEALSLLEQGRFDLALIDINLPSGKGHEIAALYRLRHAGEARTPLVALTADPSAETERLCREAGMAAVLAKPFEAGRLLSAIDAICAPADLPATVTPISTHPRFAQDQEPALDEAVIAALRGLGGEEFLADVAASFRSDAWLQLARLREAIAGGDARAFAEAAHAVGSGAANIGAARLRGLLAAASAGAVKDLRQGASQLVDRIEAELRRVDRLLAELLPEQRRM
jgi:two-component system, sensor histidine kinase RpfC